MKLRGSRILCHISGCPADRAITAYYPADLIAATTGYLSENGTGATTEQQQEKGTGVSIQFVRGRHGKPVIKVLYTSAPVYHRGFYQYDLATSFSILQGLFKLKADVVNIFCAEAFHLHTPQSS